MGGDLQPADTSSVSAMALRPECENAFSLPVRMFLRQQQTDGLNPDWMHALTCSRDSGLVPPNLTDHSLSVGHGLV